MLVGRALVRHEDHPLSLHTLESHDNLVITPHIGGCTLESMEQTEELSCGKVVSFLQSHSEADLRRG